jgi:hypothetical protein
MPSKRASAQARGAHAVPMRGSQTMRAMHKGSMAAHVKLQQTGLDVRARKFLYSFSLCLLLGAGGWEMDGGVGGGERGWQAEGNSSAAAFDRIYD